MVPVCFSHKIQGYLKVQKSFFRLYCGQFWHQKEVLDTKGILQIRKSTKRENVVSI